MDHPPLPRFEFPLHSPSLWDMLRRGVSDPASVIPVAILSRPALQLPGLKAPLLVSDPDLVRTVLNDKDGRFVRDRFIRRLFRRAWGKGLAAAKREDWHRQRRAAAPAFRPQAVERHAKAFAAAADWSAQDWPLGEPVELTQRLAQIVATIVFTTLVDGTGEVDGKAVASDMPAYIRRIGGFTLRDLLLLPEAWHDRLSGISGDPAVRRVRTLAHALAAGRRSATGGGDLVDLLEGAGPIEDNIRGLIPAAIDTTVAGASWVLYTLAMRPEWQERLAHEVRACEGALTLDRLPLARRLVQETLRLYSPAPLLTRSVAKEGELAGLPLHKGQPVILHISAMQRHHSLWGRPDCFDPDRFLSERGTLPGWLPFAAGPRMCIAAQFALTEIAMIVARLVTQFEFKAVGPDPQVTLKVATRSSNGLHVVAQRRAQLR